MPTSYLDPVLGVAYIFSDPTDLRHFSDFDTRLVAVVQHPTPQKLYMYDAQSVAVDDGSTVIKPYSVGPTDPGRWILEGVGTAPGANSFLALTDTPASYAGFAGQPVVVNILENGLVFGSSTPTSCVESPYMDNPANWAGAYIPDTVVEALQSATRHIFYHYGVPVTSTAVGGTGGPYTDEPTYWSGAVPTKATDALRDIAAAVRGHIGFPIPNVGISSGCSPFTDNPANWALGVPPTTVLEATQCVIRSLVLHMGYRVADFKRFSDNEGRYVASNLANWKDGNVPLTVGMAIRSGVHTMFLHTGTPLTPTVTGFGGAPYEDDPGFWALGAVPATIFDALLSFIDEIQNHFGIPIVNAATNNGCVPFTDPTPSHWTGGMSRTVMEATQSAITALAAHLGYPVRRVFDPREFGPECHYLDDAAHWDSGDYPKTVGGVLDCVAKEYFDHTGLKVPTVLSLNPVGCPYQKDPTYWAGLGAVTIPDAIQALVDAFRVITGFPVMNTGFRAGIEIYEDGILSNWVGSDPPLTQMEATQCLVDKCSTHLGRPLHNIYAQTFLALTDTPSTYSTHANKSVVVNPLETATEFVMMGRFDATYVVANGTAPWSDSVHDCSDPRYRHVNDPNPANPPLVDGLANAIADCVIAGYGLVHIKRGIYNTLANGTLVRALVRGEGVGNTIVRLLDDFPGSNWFLEFTGNRGGIRDLGIEIPALVGATPDSVIYLHGTASEVDNVSVSLTGTTPEANLGAIVVAEDNTSINRFFYDDGITAITEGMSGIQLGIPGTLANNPTLSKCILRTNSDTRATLVLSSDGTATGGSISECTLTQDYNDVGYVINGSGNWSGLKLNHNTFDGGSLFHTGIFTGWHVENNDLTYYGQHGINFSAGQIQRSVIAANNIERDPGATALLQPAGIALAGPGGGPAYRNRIVENEIDMGNFDYLGGVPLAGISCGYNGASGIAQRNHFIGNIISGSGDWQTGIYLEGCWHGTCNSNEVYFLGTNPVAIPAGDGCIVLINCQNIPLVANQLFFNGQNGRALRIHTTAGTSYGFTVNSNEIFLSNLAPAVVRGIEIGQPGGPSPIKLTLSVNTIMRSSAGATGIYAPDNATTGTCIGNTISGGPVNALNLGVGLVNANNETT